MTKVVEPLFLVEIEYRLALIEAERQFIEGLLRRIKEDETYMRSWKGFHPEPGRGAAEAGKSRRDLNGEGPGRRLRSRPGAGALTFDFGASRDGRRRGADRSSSRSRRSPAHETESPQPHRPRRRPDPGILRDLFRVPVRRREGAMPSPC